MRWLIYGALVFVIALIATIVSLPTSFVMEQVRKQDSRIGYSVASGTIWNGEVRGLRVSSQPVGDLTLKADWMSLFTGGLASELSVFGDGIAGRGKLKLGLTGTVRISDLRVSGSTSDLVSIRPEIRELNGQFTFDAQDIRLGNGECRSASGTVWTDILTRMESQWRWAGPELAGPLTCQNGQFVLQLAGTNSVGESVSASLEFGLDAHGQFQAIIENGRQRTQNALSMLGFVERDGRFVYEHSMPG